MRKATAAAITLFIAATFASSADARYMEYRFSGYPDRADPAVNNYLSARYDHLLQVSSRFRSYRMWKECHTIDWVQLHGDCLASFDQYEPALYGPPGT